MSKASIAWCAAITVWCAAVIFITGLTRGTGISLAERKADSKFHVVCQYALPGRGPSTCELLVTHPGRWFTAEDLTNCQGFVDLRYGSTNAIVLNVVRLGE